MYVCVKPGSCGRRSERQFPCHGLVSFPSVKIFRHQTGTDGDGLAVKTALRVGGGGVGEVR